METILKNIISQTVENFATQVADHVSQPREDNSTIRDEIIQIWNDIAENTTVETTYKGQTKTAEEKPKKKEEKKKEEKPKKEKEEKKKEEKKKEEKPKKEEEPKIGCAYVAKKGKGAGEKCGKKVIEGKPVCSSHKKYEKEYSSNTSEETPSAKPSAPEAKNVSCTYISVKGDKKGKMCGASVKEGDMCPKHAKSASKTSKKSDEPVLPTKVKPVNLTVRLDSTSGKFINKDTGFVFKSNTEPIVIERLVLGKFRALTEEDIALATQYNLKCEEPMPDFSKEDIEKIIEDMQEEDVMEEKSVHSDAGSDEDYNPEEDEEELEEEEEDDC
jgi:hypothetical protein